MKNAKGIGFTARHAVRFLFPAISVVVGLLCAYASFAGGQDAGAFKADVSRAAVTKMPAFTVDEAASTKTHTLFMGADIAINLDRAIYNVRDVWGSNWVIDINGREREISARSAPLNLKITPSLKLTEVSATIVGFRRIRAYSYANDPSVLLTRGLNQSAIVNSNLQATSKTAQNIQDVAAGHNYGGASLLAGSSWNQFSDSAMETTAQYAYSNSHPTTTTGGFPNPSATAPTTSTSTTGFLVLPGINQPFANATQALNVGLSQQAARTASVQTANGDEPTGKIATSGLDAMDVEFDIRSAKPLHNPYVVTMTKFKTQNTMAGMVQNLVYAQSLHPIDEHLSHVHFVEDGFPFNYELVDFQLHIYNRGEEVATNIAADRVELTRDEAFEYVKMEYIGAHLKDTLPATPAMAKLPADLPSRLAQGKYAGAFYVKVSKDGLADEAFSDSACTKRINDPYLDAVVKRVRFKPALNIGKPVDGIAAVQLGKLTT
jgi:hypothetical protein